MSPFIRLCNIWIMGLVLSSWPHDLAFAQQKSALPEVPGFDLVNVPAGRYHLTILVPNSLGVNYHSKAVRISRAFEISRHEVTIDQWNVCHTDGACDKAAKRRPYQTGDHPVTRVSWLDAMTYTRWLSAKTGDSYRLPTEEEWAYVAFAGEDFTRARIDELIANRKMEQTASMTRFRKTRVAATQAANKWNVAGMTGPVWEWTLTCWFPSDEENRKPRSIAQLGDPELCANRIVQGDERAHVPFFVDKVYSGGCGTGNPVDHIGFRVVREAG